jgi:hypothetical protein
MSILEIWVMKIHAITSKKVSFETAIEVPYKVKMLSAYRNYNEGKTRRRYWIEINKKGKHRICYASYNERSGKWTAPQKEQYYLFTFLAMDGIGSVRKIKRFYVNDYTHATYIEGYLERFEFDEIQKGRLEALLRRQNF